MALIFSERSGWTRIDSSLFVVLSGAPSEEKVIRSMGGTDYIWVTLDELTRNSGFPHAFPDLPDLIERLLSTFFLRPPGVRQYCIYYFRWIRDPAKFACGCVQEAWHFTKLSVTGAISIVLQSNSLWTHLLA